METLQEILGQQLPSTLIKPLPLSAVVDREVEQSPAVRIAGNMERYYINPWEMVEDKIIYTTDEVDMLNPVKVFPNWPWLRTIADIWISDRLIALYKSRRMTITWLMVFLHLWLAMFREGANIFFVSDKEEKSDKLVKRAQFIYEHIPEDMMLKPKARPSYCYLDFPGLNSCIQGVPQGANQLRQEGATAMLFDEFAFWDQARQTFMASKPTIDGGGKFTCISSPKEGFFKDLCFDLIR